jgi:predicted alpha/beta-fold hydrolase
MNKLIATIFVIAMLAASLAAQAQTAPSTGWKETISPSEPALFATIAKEITELQDRASRESGSSVARAFHAKQHSALKAELRVSAAIPEPLRVGAFAKPVTYPTWVRFSNGSGVREGDRKPDVRGLALKIEGVPGTSFTGTNTLDLLMINHAVQPARNVDQFMALVRAARDPLTLPIKLAAALGAQEATRIIAWTASNLGRRVTSLATADFWSAVPVMYGPYAVKVRLQPQDTTPSSVNASDPDFLRHDLEERLFKADVKFDLMVQFFVDEQQTPIEDASIEWKPEVAPWVKLAELVIASRDLTSDGALADDEAGNKLLFNPWNAPAEHRPLGSLMRALRVVCPASGASRGAVQAPPAPVASDLVHAAPAASSLRPGGAVLRDVTLPEFKPAWWLPGGVLQTLWMDLGKQPHAPNYRREHLPTPDGDELILDHVDQPSGGGARGRVVLVHGLEGHSGTPRLVGLANMASAHGFAVTVINFRGCATEPGETERFLVPKKPRLYFSGDSADLDLVVQTMRARHPGQRLGVVAVSWGAGTLLRWLGERGGDAAADAAVSIGAPYDLAHSGEFMKKGMGPKSVSLFLKTIVIKLEALLARFPELAGRIDLARVRAAKSFNEIDETVWAPLHGFKGAADFHAKCSSMPVLGSIGVPTLAISAENDPLNPAPDIAQAKASASPFVRFEVTRGGGHAAQFAGKTPWTSYSWNEEAAGAWLDAHLR